MPAEFSKGHERGISGSPVSDSPGESTLPVPSTDLNTAFIGEYTGEYTGLTGPTLRKQEGYNFAIYEYPNTSVQVPMIVAKISSERVFEIFYELLEPLGESVSVVLQSRHGGDQIQEGVRDDIDLVVLQSRLIDHENLIRKDGQVGIAVFNAEMSSEVQLTPWKNIIVFSLTELERFEQILSRNGLELDKDLPLRTSDGLIPLLHQETPLVFRKGSRDDFDALAVNLSVEMFDY